MAYKYVRFQVTCSIPFYILERNIHTIYKYNLKLYTINSGAPLQAWTECESLIGCAFKITGKDELYFATNVAAPELIVQTA